MEQSDLIVRRIKDGTVIDHINEGKGLKVLEALEIDGSHGNVITIALNMPSGKLKKKDMIYNLKDQEELHSQEVVTVEPL